MAAALTADRGIMAKAVRGFMMLSFITRMRELTCLQFCETRNSSLIDHPDIAAMLGTVPQVSEIPTDGAPDISAFNEYNMTWYNKTFAAMVELKESALRGDQTGQTLTFAGQMGARLANFLDLLFYTRLQNGTSATLVPAYTRPGDAATPLFSATHYLTSSITINNIVTGSTSAAYVLAYNNDAIALKIQNDLRTAIAQMQGFKDDQNQPFHERQLEPDDLIIICSPLMKTPMDYALGAKFLLQSDNRMIGAVKKVISSPYLPISGAAAATWYLLRANNSNRPFVYSRFQTRTPQQMEDVVATENFQSTGAEFGNISQADLRNMATMEISTNLGKRGSNAEYDTMVNRRYLIKAQFIGNIIAGEFRNIVQIANTAS